MAIELQALFFLCWEETGRAWASLYKEEGGQEPRHETR